MRTQEYINELKELIEALSHQTQYIGFNHKFYVPGWIGLIQESIVESKMSKVAKQPIYKGLNYYECGNRIVELTSKACNALIESEDYQGKDNPENLVIMSTSFKALDAWTNVFPEIAYWMNYKINDSQVTCALGVLQNSLKESLSKIVRIPNEKDKQQSSFGQEMKAMGGQIVAYICNMIVLGIIFGILSAIFG